MEINDRTYDREIVEGRIINVPIVIFFWFHSEIPTCAGKLKNRAFSRMSNFRALYVISFQPSDMNDT